MTEYADGFNCGNRRKLNPTFKKKLDVYREKREEKEGLIAEIRELQLSLRSMPCGDQMDESYNNLLGFRDTQLLGDLLLRTNSSFFMFSISSFAIRKFVNIHLAYFAFLRHTIFKGGGMYDRWR